MKAFVGGVVGSLSWKAGFGGAGGVHPTLPAPPAKLAGTPIGKMREGWGTCFVLGWEGSRRKSRSPSGMRTRMAAAKARAAARWLVEGVHPTLRKMREGWGTRGFWVGGGGAGKTFGVVGSEGDSGLRAGGMLGAPGCVAVFSFSRILMIRSVTALRRF